MRGGEKISQSEVEEYLKRNEQVKFTAKELQVRLDLAAGIYHNLKRIRECMKCIWCSLPVRGEVACCVGCGWKIEGMIRCSLLEPKRDSRGRVYVYWYQK